MLILAPPPCGGNDLECNIHPPTLSACGRRILVPSSCAGRRRRRRVRGLQDLPSGFEPKVGGGVSSESGWTTS
eukprot:5355097-Pyramimonas_sp.AAC.1